MGDNVSGEVKVKIIDATGESGGGGAQSPVADSQKKEADEMSSIGKMVSAMGKVMKKVSPVADMAGLIVYLLKKSAVLWTLIETFLDVVGAFVDVFLANVLVPLLMPFLKLMVQYLPFYQGIMEIVGAIMGVIGQALDLIVSPIVNAAKTAADMLRGVGKGLDIIDWLADRIGDLVDMVTQLAGTTESVISSGSGILSSIGGFLGFQQGISYVPQTMTAELHRGESVLTAKETQERRNGGGGISVQNPQFTINAGGTSTVDAKVFGALLYREFSKKLTDEARRQ